MFSSIKIYLFLIILALGGGVVWYYKSTQATIAQLNQYNATLTANVEQMEQVNQQNVEVINGLQSDYDNSIQNFNELQEQFISIRRENNELRERLGRHELDALALAKPGLVERVINNASQKAMRCFELLSGAELTEQEKGAKNAKAFNSECPWIYDDLVSSGLLIVDGQGTTESSN